MEIGFWLNLLSGAYAACETNHINATSNLIGRAAGVSHFIQHLKHQVDVHSAIQRRSRSETTLRLCLHAAVFALEFLPRM